MMYMPSCFHTGGLPPEQWGQLTVGRQLLCLPAVKREEAPLGQAGRNARGESSLDSTTGLRPLFICRATPERWMGSPMEQGQPALHTSLAPGLGR